MSLNDKTLVEPKPTNMVPDRATQTFAITPDAYMGGCQTTVQELLVGTS